MSTCARLSGELQFWVLQWPGYQDSSLHPVGQRSRLRTKKRRTLPSVEQRGHSQQTYQSRYQSRCCKPRFNALASLWSWTGKAGTRMCLKRAISSASVILSCLSSSSSHEPTFSSSPASPPCKIFQSTSAYA